MMSCSKNKKPNSDTSAFADVTDSYLKLAENGKSEYLIVTPCKLSESFNKSLEQLQGAVELKSGTRLKTITADAVAKEALNDSSSKLILLGAPELTSPAIMAAKGYLGESGFSAICNGNILVLYASNDVCFSDLVSLFVSKHITEKNGAALVDPEIRLVRAFKEYKTPSGDEHGYTMPVITVKTDNGAGITSKEVYVGASVSVENVYSELSLGSVRAQIKGRGNGTWTYVDTKKPYRLKFDEKVNLLGIGQGSSRDWVLMSNPHDFTQMRNTVAFALAQKIYTNVDYSSPFIYVHLYLGDRYAGIYCVCEQMEISSHKIEVNEDPVNAAGSEYFIELDTYASRDGYKKGTDYFKVADKRWKIKSDYNSTERCSYVENKFKEMFEAIDIGDRELIEYYIDIDSCVDMYLLHEYAKNIDVGWSSFYMVLRTDGRLYFTAPWDFDLSSGNDKRIDGGIPEGLHAGTYTTNDHTNPIFERLMKLDFFEKLVKERYLSTYAQAEALVMEHLDHYANTYSEEFAADVALNYSRGNGHNMADGGRTGYELFMGNVEFLKNWYRERTEWLKNYFEEI